MTNDLPEDREKIKNLINNANFAADNFFAKDQPTVDEITDAIMAIIHSANDAAIREFTKNRVVLEQFECGIHGKTDPMPECSECFAEKRDTTLDKLLERLPEEKTEVSDSHELGYDTAIRETRAIIKALKEGE